MFKTFRVHKLFTNKRTYHIERYMCNIIVYITLYYIILH